MSRVEAGPVRSSDMLATSTSGPVSAPSIPTNLTLTLSSTEWQPNADPVNEFPDRAILECFANSFTGGTLRNAYTMNIHTAYSFDATDQLFTNQSVTALELEGVLFAQDFASPLFTDERLNAAFDNSLAIPTFWKHGERQICARVIWKFSVAPSLRRGTFRIDSSPPGTALYVQSAALIVTGEPTGQTDTLGDTSATDSAVPSAVSATASSSSSPNLGVIIPAILVPIILIAGTIVAFVFWRNRQQRRRRLAPSAAFREDHAATIARGVEGGGRGASPVPSNAAAYIPLDEKRAFNFST